MFENCSLNKSYRKLLLRKLNAHNAQNIPLAVSHDDYGRFGRGKDITSDVSVSFTSSSQGPIFKSGTIIYSTRVTDCNTSLEREKPRS